MSAVRQVYENDDLVRHILDHLDTTQLLGVLTLDKSIFRSVIGILCRHVRVEYLAELDYYGSPRIAEYRRAVRYIDAILAALTMALGGPELATRCRRCCEAE